jgi:hypothetical protein
VRLACPLYIINFPGKDNKIKSYFDGPLGLLFIFNLANAPFQQYLPFKAEYQLFFAQETAAQKKLLKSIEIYKLLL